MIVNVTTDPDIKYNDITYQTEWDWSINHSCITYQYNYRHVLFIIHIPDIRIFYGRMVFKSS